MDGLAGSVGDQMSVAHGHINGFVAHERFDSVNIHPGQGQPAGESVAQSVEDHPAGAVIGGEAIIEPHPIHQLFKLVAQIFPQICAEKRGENKPINIRGVCFALRQKFRRRRV